MNAMNVVVVSWRAKDSWIRNCWRVKLQQTSEDVTRDSVSARREADDFFRTSAGKTVGRVLLKSTQSDRSQLVEFISWVYCVATKYYN